LQLRNLINYTTIQYCNYATLSTDIFLNQSKDEQKSRCLSDQQQRNNWNLQQLAQEFACGGWVVVGYYWILLNYYQPFVTQSFIQLHTI
jgi:hypothetical protein